MKDMAHKETERDLERAYEALKSAERNFKENDMFTAANRTFVACENAIYVLLKLKFGSVSISRIKILTRLRDINPKAREVYDQAYDLRVQADYGNQAKTLPLTKKNVEEILNQVKNIVKQADKEIAKLE
tara:strand:+ start:4123 stop:4509 length:387 start_codon:yes stop_codon:yes gene_type:complete